MRFTTLAIAILWLLLAAAGAGAHPPYSLAADPSGHVYFSDLETVWRLSPDGRLAVFRPRTPDTHVHEVVIAPDGAVEGDQNRYEPATQRFYTGLWRRTAEGRERMVVAMTEDAPPGLGVWQDRRGNRYASHWPSNEDRRTMLTRRSADGRAEVVFAEGKPARPAKRSVAGVGGMAFGADGSVFFADRDMLRRLGPDGRTRLLHRGGAGSSLRGIALAPDGRVLVADMGLRMVIAVAPGGRVETLYRETGPWLPTAVASVGGRLLVLEANADPHERKDRVRVIEAAGSGARVVAQPGGAGAEARQAPAAINPDGDRNATLVAAGAALAGAAACAGAWAAWRRRGRR